MRKNLNHPTLKESNKNFFLPQHSSILLTIVCNKREAIWCKRICQLLSLNCEISISVSGGALGCSSSRADEGKKGEEWKMMKQLNNWAEMGLFVELSSRARKGKRDNRVGWNDDTVAHCSQWTDTKSRRKADWLCSMAKKWKLFVYSFALLLHLWPAKKNSSRMKRLCTSAVCDVIVCSAFFIISPASINT